MQGPVVVASVRWYHAHIILVDVLMACMLVGKHTAALLADLIP
jgi:hypothetical protein